MRKRGLIGFVILVVVVLIFVVGAVVVWNFFGKITGKVVDGFGGPSVEDSECLRNCVVDEGRSEDVCMVECGVEPEPVGGDDGEVCMQECVNVGCDEYDVACVQGNMEKCEDECGMKGDAPDESEMNEEQLCISECVDAEDPSVICGSSKEGETGNALCRRCADECVYLYAGPCLTDEELEEKEAECESCEHCYGEPVEGPSGQGWDCIVDIECGDASAEFGDEAGSGPGVGDEGYVAPNIVMKVVDSVVGFFKGLFSKNT